MRRAGSLGRPGVGRLDVCGQPCACLHLHRLLDHVCQGVGARDAPVAGHQNVHLCERVASRYPDIQVFEFTVGGGINRPVAAKKMAGEAMKMSPPSNATEKYLAFSWTKGWRSLVGVRLMSFAFIASSASWFDNSFIF